MCEAALTLLASINFPPTFYPCLLCSCHSPHTMGWGEHGVLRIPAYCCVPGAWVLFVSKTWKYINQLFLNTNILYFTKSLPESSVILQAVQKGVIFPKMCAQPPYHSSAYCIKVNSQRSEWYNAFLTKPK